MANKPNLMDKRKIIGLLALSILLVPLFACKTDSRDTFRPQTILFENGYRTNVVGVAQKETPFTIILPTYVPDDLIFSPYLEGPKSDLWNEHNSIRIMYYTQYYTHGPYRTTPVMIEESNYEIYYLSPDRYLTMSGIEVSETELESYWPTDLDTFSLVRHLRYDWNDNGVHYCVDTYDYDQSEARKIVESMIIQD
jgi:hypothetical protein